MCIIAKTDGPILPTSNNEVLAAPKTVDYYPHIGVPQHNSAWLPDPGGLR